MWGRLLFNFKKSIFTLVMTHFYIIKLQSLTWYWDPYISYSGTNIYCKPSIFHMLQGYHTICGIFLLTYKYLLPSHLYIPFQFSDPFSLCTSWHHPIAGLWLLFKDTRPGSTLITHFRWELFVISPSLFFSFCLIDLIYSYQFCLWKTRNTNYLIFLNMSLLSSKA